MKTLKQKETEPSVETVSRRSFISVIWGGMGVVALAEFLWIGLSFFKPRRSSNDPIGKIIELGAVEDFTPNSVTPIKKGGFYLSRLENGGFLAVSPRCTHLGCAVTWNTESTRFECPCHSSVFDIKGDVIRPPAPRALDYFKVVIENQQIKVHLSEKIKRSRFHDKQVTNV